MMTRASSPNIYYALQEQWAKLAPAWDKFDDKQLAQLKSLLSTNWDALVTHMSPADLAALSTAIQEKLGIGSKILKNRLKNIKLEDVASWVDEQWQRVPLDNLMSMDWTVLQEVPISEVGKWTEVWICDHDVCRVLC